jgi:hypothetical protein
MQILEPRSRTDRRGMALAAAVFALAVMGGLIAGNFAAGLLEQQSGRNTLFVLQAAEAAEGAIQEALLLAPASALADLPVGGPAYSLGSASFGGVMVQREIVRLTERLFLIRARASRADVAGTPLATRTLGLLVKLAADSGASAASVVPLTQRPWVQLY